MGEVRGRIPSKPTRYHRSFCRSRTEARWAVFFDALSLRYIHEDRDIYLLKRQERYLPDFKIGGYPSCGERILIEIKGRAWDESEKKKCIALCEQEQFTKVLLIYGNPSPGNHEMILYYTDYKEFECIRCDSKIPEDGERCPNCSVEEQMIIPYLPSGFVTSKPVRFAEVIGDEFGASRVFLSPTNTTINLLWNKTQKSLLDFAYQLASRAHFEHLQNDIPSLYQGDCWPFNPAFQTQDWDFPQLIYQAMEEVLRPDEGQFLVDCEVTPFEARECCQAAINCIEKGQWSKLCENLADALIALKKRLDGYVELFIWDENLIEQRGFFLSTAIGDLLKWRRVDREELKFLDWYYSKLFAYYYLYGLAYERDINCFLQSGLEGEEV